MLCAEVSTSGKILENSRSLLYYAGGGACSTMIYHENFT